MLYTLSEESLGHLVTSGYTTSHSFQTHAKRLSHSRSLSRRIYGQLKEVFSCKSYNNIYITVTYVGIASKFNLI